MIFIDLKKAYDRVPRKIMWWILEKKEVTKKYIELVKDMHDKAITFVKTTIRETNEFLIIIYLYQRFVLSSYLFILVIYELTKYIQDDISWYMSFADDIVLIDETKSKVNAKLEVWRETLKSKSFKISKTKIEYIKHNFSKNRNINEEIVKIASQEVLRSKKCKYLGSIIYHEGEINENVNHKVKV